MAPWVRGRGRVRVRVRVGIWVGIRIRVRVRSPMREVSSCRLVLIFAPK